MEPEEALCGKGGPAHVTHKQRKDTELRYQVVFARSGGMKGYCVMKGDSNNW